MNKREIYDGNPLKFLLIARKGLMSEVLWIIWFIFAILLAVFSYFGIIDISRVHIGDLVDSSIAGLSFSLIVVSAALEVFKRDELKRIYLGQNNSKDGLLLMKMLSPYVFTSMIFLVLGVMSIIAPLIAIKLPNLLKEIMKYMYIIILILGLLSLFNISYEIVMHIFNSIRRDVLKDN